MRVHEEHRDLLQPDARAALLRAPRPVRRLPIAPAAPPPRPPLAREARARDRAARPIHAVWELTLACDLSCRHCGSRAGAARPDELTTAEALDLVGQMTDLGVREVTLIGGEVYLHPGWLDVIRAIRRRRMQATLVTGGRGMTRARARDAAGAGLQSMSVSIDGTAETHDRLRGVAGSHAAARAAIHHARAEGIPVAINTQINRLSAGDLGRVLSDVVAAEGAHGWQLQLTVPSGRAADEPDVLLQPFDLLRVVPVLAALKRDCDARGIRMLTGNNIGYFGPYEHVLRSYCEEGHRGACPAGMLVLGIESNGDIKGCPSLPSDGWTGGNIREHGLSAIWERAEALRFNRDRTHAQLWGYCADCYYADACRGGCTWMATTLFGKAGNNPYCHHRALELQRVGKRERVVMDREAPGKPFDHGHWQIVVEDASDPEDAGNDRPSPRSAS